ncbi:hypothetical protein SCHPADRAFT_938591 [Schizopora paradoxa]|uniref:DUF6534 domain-containing protein n=1 Tax=Schizopora paradoxa TaxID=27342 RepID=A0A0H2RVH2_9AGAM|nr:hypothetical protein SCHPADRAFT_938591 [Schizopora paradoxa]
MPSIIAQTGPLFIGTILNYLLTGILIHQLFDYNKNYPNDKWHVKWLVYGVCTLDMLQTGFTTQLTWFYCVQNWGNESLFTGSGFAWTASILPIMAGLVAMIVQFFYAWRIWCLGGRYFKMCSAVISLIAFVECLCAFIGSIKFDIMGVSEIRPAIVPYFAIWLSGSFTCDVLIAVCMSIIFFRARMRTGFEKTTSILNMLILHVVETAAITAICSGVELVLFCTSRNTTLAHTAPAFVLGKLYTNCLLANLNNRKHLTSVMNSNSDASSGNVTNSFRLRNIRPLSERKQPPTITELMSIRVDEVRHVQRDGGDSTSGSIREGHKKSLEEEGKISSDDASEATFAYKTDSTAIEQERHTYSFHESE